MRKFLIGFAVVATVALSLASEARTPDHVVSALAKPVEAKHDIGVASWYGEKFQGSTTASGEPYDMNGLTCAHRELPLGTRIRVTNLQNNRFAVLRINDRGPVIPNRLLDVSKAAARSLGFVRAGLATVRVEIVPPTSLSTPSIPPATKRVAF
jgi:rare lipoprotein A